MRTRFYIPIFLAIFALACKQIPGGTNPSSSPTPDPGNGSTQTDSNVKGFFDAIDSTGLATGWSYDKSNSAASNKVEIYVDGDLITGRLVGTRNADASREDVNASEHITGNHGYRFRIPDSLRDGVDHTLRIYGVGANGKKELEGSPKKFNIFVPCRTAGPWVDHTENEYVVTLKAFNEKFVSADCGGDDDGQLGANRDSAGEWETFYVARQTDGTVTVRSSHGRYLSAENGGGGAIHANRKAAGPWESFRIEGSLSEGAVVGLKTSDGVHYWSSRLDKDPPPVSAEASAYVTWEQFRIHVISSPVKARRGIVHAENQSFVDDDGAFYPLGATLMWALRGWRFERDRLKQNLKFLSSHGWDYVRILAEVNWPGNEIDPRWPGYQQDLGEFLDYAYDECGLRTEITLIGDGSNINAYDTAAIVLPVIQAGRQHKIMNMEVANESDQRRISLEDMRRAGTLLMQNLPNLVAISSVEGTHSFIPDSGDWRADIAAVFLKPGTANMYTVHMDRGFGDLGWRAVRQPWDFKDLSVPVSHNEPIGPRSSVAEEVDPVRLAMLRAVGLINGVQAFVLHNGTGVVGQIDPGHNRPANLWEVPGIDDIMNAVRRVDSFLPPRASEGQHWNNSWAQNPWVADEFWGESGDRGVNRNYTVATGDGWISTEAGVKDYVMLVPRRKSLIEVFDVLQGKVSEVLLEEGQRFRLEPLSRDNYGLGAYIIIGHYR